MSKKKQNKKVVKPLQNLPSKSSTYSKLLALAEDAKTIHSPDGWAYLMWVVDNREYIGKALEFFEPMRYTLPAESDEVTYQITEKGRQYLREHNV